MKIYVKYFASVRDIMGKDSEDLEIETSPQLMNYGKA